MPPERGINHPAADILPAQVWPPGTFILEEIAFRDMTINELSRNSGIAIERLIEILSSVQTIYEEDAVGLSKALGPSKRMFLALQDAWTRFNKQRPTNNTR